MERRRFGPTKQEVAVVGQGTWYLEDGDRASAIARRGLPGLEGRADNASRLETLAVCERSLARLGIDRLDCYLLHWRGEHALEDTFAAFEQLQREGKILSGA